MARYANDADNLLVMPTHGKEKVVSKESWVDVLATILGLVSSDDESDESDVDSISSIRTNDLGQISDDSDEWSDEKEISY